MNGCTVSDNRDIQIIMSTYNGAHYLREQLDSILNQKAYSRVKVLIRDDGSTDGTVSILKEYAEQYNFELLIGQNLGVTGSIRALLQASDDRCKYFSISDQDDVWLPDKLTCALEHLEHESPELPLLFGSLSHVVDAKLHDLGSSVQPIKGVSYYNAMVQNVTAGHTQVFNRTLRNLLLLGDFENVHVVDWWIYLTASGLGKVIFADQFTVLHRQHGNNEVGCVTNPLQRTWKRLRSLREGKGNAITIQLQAFYQQYGMRLPDDFQLETLRYLDCQDSIIRRIQYAMTCHAYRQETIENILFKILYIMGKYQVKR